MHSLTRNYTNKVTIDSKYGIIAEIVRKSVDVGEQSKPSCGKRPIETEKASYLKIALYKLASHQILIYKKRF